MKSILLKTFLFLSIIINQNIFAYELPNKLIEEMKEFSEKAFSFCKVPGAAFAIITPEKVLLLKTKGVRRLNQDEKINEDTIFRIASLSKILTSMLVTKLYFDKKIDFEDTIDKYFPNLKIGKKENIKNIKIKHLLSHTTGILRYCLEHEAYNNQPFNSLLKNLKLAKKISEPGECFQYQNVLFSLIAPIIEKVSSKDFEENMKNEIFVPLKMNNSTANQEIYNLTSNIAFPHIREKFDHKPLENKSYYHNIIPAGGISSNIKDMIKVTQVLMGGYNNIFGQEFLSKILKPLISYKTKRKKKCKKSNCNRCKRYISEHYGLGCRILNYSGNKIIYHGGELNGFTSRIAFSPEYKVGIIILTNSDKSPFPILLTDHFFDVLFNLPYPDWNKIKERINRRINRKKNKIHI